MRSTHGLRHRRDSDLKVGQSREARDSDSSRRRTVAAWARQALGRLRLLGPGLITGCSDDDPSGIATYSQAGAQFGLQMLWVMPLTVPLMASVQEISARIGRTTGAGLAGNLRRRYPGVVVYLLVGLIVVANTINLGADLGAMGAALTLLVGDDRWHVYPLCFGAASLAAEVLFRYRPYASLLKWFSFTVAGYVGIAFTVQIPWASVLYHTVVPSIAINGDYLLTLVAVLGTTISPYLFFWQSSQEVEEQASAGEPPVRRAPRLARRQFQRIRFDTAAGMVISNVVAYFIILTTATALFANGIHDISTSAQAASALEPIAGRFATLLFAASIIGTGLLAVPVLAGSAGYAVAEALRWPIGLDQKPSRAVGFYCVIGAATLFGTLLNFSTIDPIRALYWSAVLNGIAAVPILFVLMRMGSDSAVMGRMILPPGLRLLGWLTTAVMAFAAVGMIWVGFASKG
jgi:NRAMP (natural resistance-associated macrophage protein)-like metal ion transporter